jgi:uncharacterized lipoprotein NlpE involved in copper resistance
MKKLIAYLLIFTIFNLVGCYTREQIILPSAYHYNDDADLTISMKDTSFVIKKGSYKLYDDTLICTFIRTHQKPNAKKRS